MANPENKQIPYESTQKDIRDAIESVAMAIGGIAVPSADHVSYDNSGSGLSATDVQNALDEIVSDIPTVNDGTLTIQQNGETKGTFTANQSGNSTVNIETPTTDIQTAVDEFETYNGGLLSECKVALSPNQDLHGYDNPWVGGAGKNKLPLILADIKSANGAGTWSGNVYSYSGLTIEVIQDTNGNVTGFEFNGTPSVGFGFKITQSDIANFPTGNYIYSIQNTINMGGLWVSIYSPQSKAIFVDNQTSVAVDVTEGQLFGGGYIYTNAGNVFNNVLIQPMLRLSTESDPTFEPYSNICPISGHTQVEVDVSDGQTTQEQVTVNLGDTYYSGTLDVVTGVFTPDTAKKIYNGTEAFAMSTGTNYHQFYMSFPVNITKTNIICDSFITIEFSERGQKTGIAVLNDPTIRFCFKDDEILISTLAEFTTWLTNHPVEIVYPLATPTPIQLSPTMVKALVGENHLSAPLDGQEITESKYKQMFTFDDVIAYIQSLS